MIHSIKFKDISEEIAQAKVGAKECDAKYDKEYAEYLKDVEELRKKEAEFDENHKKDPDKYPSWRRPSAFRCLRRGEMEKRTHDKDWHDLVSSPYMNALDSLNGKEFKFTEGLNVIVGANGVGKTSLLKVIRTIFVAEGKNHSLVKGQQYWHLDLEHEVIPMLEICELKADYRRCVFNLLHDRDIDKNNPWVGGIDTFMQMYEGMHSSKGEKGLIAINAMFGEFAKGTKMDIDDPKNPRGMESEVLGTMREGVKRYSGECGQKIQRVLDYYAANQVDDKRFTIIMDEPDSGFDVFKAKDLCDMLERMANDTERNIIQPIVVLHNVAIISRLMKNASVNFIELTPNYLETVRKFF